MKKIIFLITIIFLFTGCKSYTELNDLSIVNTLGIDFKDNKYILKLTTIETDQDNNKIINIYSSNRNTLEDSYQDIYLSLNKKLYLSHINLLILTSDAINNNLNEILNDFLKNNEYRNNFYVVLMDNTSINNFFNKEYNYNSKDITKLIDVNIKETGITYKKELESFIKDILIDKNSYLPTISLKDNKTILNGFTLIKDNKVYKELSNKDSIILNILNNNLNKTYIDNMYIYENKTSIKLKDNNIIFNLNMTTSNNNIDLLKNDLLEFINKYKDNNYDILKVKEIFKKNNYNYYKKGIDLKNINFIINIKNKIKEDYIEGEIFEE